MSALDVNRDYEVNRIDPFRQQRRTQWYSEAVAGGATPAPIQEHVFVEHSRLLLANRTDALGQSRNLLRRHGWEGECQRVDFVPGNRGYRIGSFQNRWLGGDRGFGLSVMSIARNIMAFWWCC